MRIKFKKIIVSIALLLISIVLLTPRSDSETNPVPTDYQHQSEDRKDIQGKAQTMDGGYAPCCSGN